MSWVNRIENIELEVITGDGLTYRPLWKNAKRSVNYNSEIYEFAEIEGSFVDRRLEIGRRFPILFYFKGEDNIEITNSFLESSKNINPWTIRHPLYDDIIVQPLELNIDNSSMNLSIITGTVVETITNEFPQESNNIRKKVRNRKQDIDEININSFTDNVEVSSIEAAVGGVDIVSSNFASIVQDEESEFKNIVRLASSAARDVINNSNRYIQSVIDLINFPFQVSGSIQTKLQIFKDTIETLLSVFTNDKGIYANNATTLLSLACVTAVNPNDSDYKNSSDVVRVIDQITEMYNFIYTAAENDINYEVAQQVDFIVNTTIDNLYQISFNSRRHYTFLADKDDNVINLCHRFYKYSDENLNRFINENDFSLNEFLQIKKGKKIIYYV